MSTKTRYFQNCLGVFQGGGCKGAAYVGAYKECVERGVAFSEVVGTSAGAIIAVFIAAGATPAKLDEIMRRLNFKHFERDAEKIELDELPWIIRNCKSLLKVKYKKFHTIISRLGMYESSYIEQFINDNLKEILHMNRNVLFSDLIIPCSVVVSDLLTNNVTEYSTSQTPAEEVAKAVRKSSNIPIFFQPIENRYVDGGMLSNLPAYLFKGKDTLYNKVLAFTFKPDQEIHQIKNIEDYVLALVNTALFGSTNIQLALTNGVSFIEIPTGNIKSTDFQKLDEGSISFLTMEGEKAASLFFDNEIVKLKNYNFRPDINFSSNDSNNTITDTNNDNIRDVIIVESDTGFIYELFPTFLNLVKHRVKIQILLKENNDHPIHGPYRQRLLRHMGAEIEILQDIPFKGMLFNSGTDFGKAIIYNQAEKDNQPYHSKFYHGEEDNEVIKLLRQSVDNLFKNYDNEIKLTFKKINPSELIAALKKN